MFSFIFHWLLCVLSQIIFTSFCSEVLKVFFLTIIGQSFRGKFNFLKKKLWFHLQYGCDRPSKFLLRSGHVLGERLGLSIPH